MMRNRASQQMQCGEVSRHAPSNKMSSPVRINETLLQAQRNVFMMLSLVLFTLLLVIQFAPTTLPYSEGCDISFGEFKGHQYESPASGTIGKPKCLLESKWLRLSQHAVQFPGTDKVLDDWLWIDYHDRINVLVEDETLPGEERKFLVFEQSKYALEGRQSLAIIGGIMEPGEEAENAARREVDEEMDGLQCDHFHFLGRYRTDVNRGMGWLNSFLATGCSKDPNRKKHQALEDEVGAADTERQDLKRITLTELKDAARDGKFLEVQWSATVALALLHPEMLE